VPILDPNQAYTFSQIFGLKVPPQKQVTEVLALYSVPRELETVERILIKALMPE
jgi:hypothetical protein